MLGQRGLVSVDSRLSRGVWAAHVAVKAHDDRRPVAQWTRSRRGALALHSASPACVARRGLSPVKWAFRAKHLKRMANVAYLSLVGPAKGVKLRPATRL